jgi:hypothetical protein
MEYSPLNAVRKDAAQQARDFLVAVLGYLYVESKRRFSNLEVSDATTPLKNLFRYGTRAR